MNLSTFLAPLPQRNEIPLKLVNQDRKKNTWFNKNIGQKYVTF